MIDQTRILRTIEAKLEDALARVADDNEYEDKAELLKAISKFDYKQFVDDWWTNYVEWSERA